MGAPGSEDSGVAVAACSGTDVAGSEGGVVGVGWGAAIDTGGSGVEVADSPQLAAAKTNTNSMVRKPRPAFVTLPGGLFPLLHFSFDSLPI